MRLDKDAVIGAFIGFALTASVSFAGVVRPGSPPPPGPAPSTVTRSSVPVFRAPPIIPSRVERFPDANRNGAVSVEAAAFGAGRVDHEEAAPVKVPTFAGRPMGRKLLPCAYDHTVFSDDCTPR